MAAKIGSRPDLVRLIQSDDGFTQFPIYAIVFVNRPLEHATILHNMIRRRVSVPTSSGVLSAWEQTGEIQDEDFNLLGRGHLLFHRDGVITDRMNG